MTNIEFSDLPEIITRKEAVAFLRLNRSTLDRLNRDGSLPSFKLGTKVFFARQDIEAYINASRVATVRENN